MVGRRRLSPDERREELLNAAVALATEAGDLAAPTLERVAERAGCSRNLAYRYFANHDALVDGIAARERVVVIQRFAAVPVQDDFHAWFAGVVDVVLDLAEERGTLLLMLYEQSMFPRASRRRELVDITAARVAAAGVTGGRANAAAAVIGSSLVGGAGAMITGAATREEVTATLMTVAEALVGGA